MLRDDFESILKDFGTNILLVRNGVQLRCSCWSEKNQEADRNCPICYGLGMVPSIEKHTARSQVMSIPQTLPRAVTGSTMGEMLSSAKAFFLKHDVKVKVGDLIVEVDWSPTGKPIYNGGDVGSVNFVDPKRFKYGQVTFIKAYVASEPVEQEVRGINIANANGIKNYQIMWG